MVTYGKRLFGKVDAVPGLGHVATKCYHINYIPLIPTEGWFVTAQKGNRWSGFKIPISFKSYFIAWARVAAFCMILFGAIFSIVSVSDSAKDPAMLAVWSVVILVGIAMLVASYKVPMISRASYARACQLAKHAKISDAGLLAIAQAYGQPPVSYGFTPLPATNSDQSPDDAPPVAMVPSPRQPLQAQPVAQIINQNAAAGGTVEPGIGLDHYGSE